MNKSARIQKRLILLIAFSMVWIFIGSLVVFHQEHVMGKTFKWHNITFLVPKSKEKTISAFLKPSSTDQVDHDFVADLTGAVLSLKPFAAIISIAAIPSGEPFFEVYQGLALHLRAPPQA